MAPERRVALVTGASRGIGRAIALRLGREGMAVAVNYATNVHAAEEVAQAVRACGVPCVTVQADLRSEAEVARMVSTVVGELGQVDVLVNNAGVMHPVTNRQPFWETPTSRWDDLLTVNLRGPFLCSKYVARHLLARKIPGRIVNLTSVAGAVVAMPNVGVEYEAAKAGMVGLTFHMAAELAPHGITVNAVAPGSVPTDMSAHLRNPELARSRAARIPLGRLGDVEDIAGAVAFLTSDDASFITGQLIVVDGGFTRLITT